jgi:creatinine amidohydrolase
VRSRDFSELTTTELDELAGSPHPPVLLLPAGAVEPHGPHAPLGTDVLIAQAICERTAQALAGDERHRALVLPALPYGVTRYAAAFRGAAGVSESTLTALVVELCQSLARDGFAKIVVVNCHFEPEQVRALRDAVSELGDGVRLFDLTRRALASRLTDEFRRGSCHAGSYETSLVLSERPELIDTALASDLPALDVNMPAAIGSGQTDFVAMGMDQAYCGAPAEATAEEGQRTYAVLTEMLIELIRELDA